MHVFNLGVREYTFVDNLYNKNQPVVPLRESLRPILEEAAGKEIQVSIMVVMTPDTVDVSRGQRFRAFISQVIDLLPEGTRPGTCNLFLCVNNKNMLNKKKKMLNICLSSLGGLNQENWIKEHFLKENSEQDQAPVMCDYPYFLVIDPLEEGDRGRLWIALGKQEGPIAAAAMCLEQSASRRMPLAPPYTSLSPDFNMASSATDRGNGGQSRSDEIGQGPTQEQGDNAHRTTRLRIGVGGLCLVGIVAFVFVKVRGKQAEPAPTQEKQEEEVTQQPSTPAEEEASVA